MLSTSIYVFAGEVLNFALGGFSCSTYGLNYIKKTINSACIFLKKQPDDIMNHYSLFFCCFIREFHSNFASFYTPFSGW